jgi:hypothetical protein
MQTGRINVYPTTTTIPSITPPNGTAVCKDLITFTVQVDGYTAPDGYVIIQDVVDGYVVGSGTLSSISSTASRAIITAVLSNRPGNYVAYYPYPYVLEPQLDRDANGKVLQSFGPSQSSISQYNIGYAPTITTVTTPVGSSFCYHQNFSITASVNTSGGAPITDGYVLFRLFTSGGLFFTDLALAQVSAGVATGTIPADTVSADGYYLQAAYLGEDCFGPSMSPSGVSGTPISAIRLNATTVGLPSLLGTNCKSKRIMFRATVSATVLSAPSIGSVTFSTTSPLSIVLGTSYISDGVVPNTTVAPASGGQTLPQSTIHVSSTTGFTSSGTFYIETNLGTQAITYTGKTATTFTGCTGGGSGETITVSGAVCAFAAPAGTIPTDGSWSVIATYNSDGYCYAGSVSSAAAIDIANC